MGSSGGRQEGEMGKWKALVDADLAMTTAIYKTLGPGGVLGPRWGAVLWEAFSLGGDGFTWFGLVPVVAYLYAGAGTSGYKVLASFESTQILCCLVVDLAAIACMKTIFKRARPPHHKTDFRFVGPDVHSFPSGHATRCWTILGTLAFLAARSPEDSQSALAVVSILTPLISLARLRASVLFGWGVLMCVGRVALGRHYVTDVLAGCFLGRYVIAPLAIAIHSLLLRLLT